MALPNGVLLVVQGCGALGLNVAGEMLRRGCRVRLCDNRPDITRIRFAELTTRLRALCEEGLLLQGDIEYLLSRCSVAESMVDAVEADCTCLVIVEAVPDQVALKNAVFSAAAAACAAKSIDPAKVLFCSNSLNLSVASATATMPPEYAARVVGVRFMHPVWFVDEVEVTVADEEDHAPRVHKLTSQSPELSSVPQPQLPTDSTVATQHEARNFLASIGMKPFLISIDATSTRRRLTSEQSLLYMVRQKTQCEADERFVPGFSGIADGSPWVIPQHLTTSGAVGALELEIPRADFTPLAEKKVDDAEVFEQLLLEDDLSKMLATDKLGLDGLLDMQIDGVDGKFD